jgi:hypothetical protein
MGLIVLDIDVLPPELQERFKAVLRHPAAWPMTAIAVFELSSYIQYRRLPFAAQVRQCTVLLRT